MRFYNLALYVLLPLVFLRLLWRSRKNPAYRQGWSQRLGECSAVDGIGAIWIHAVSVGESQAAEPLVRQLRQSFPDREILITTTTPTGADHVAKLFGSRVRHCYFPFDLPVALTRFLDRVQPSLLLMMETEIWPNLLLACSERRIPTLLANARLSEKSARRYGYLPNLTRQVFRSIGHIAAQSDTDAERFIALGVPEGRITVTGSLKFDMTLPASLFEQAEVVRRDLGPQRPIWVAASTREGEEPLVLQAHRQLLEEVPGALLVLVPRHPERFDPVEDLCRQQGFRMQRRSRGLHCSLEIEVYLGDSMGELPLLLAAGDAAFIGGSLVKLGGHNVLEAAVLGKPVTFGPHMFNFSAISQMLLDGEAASQVDSPAALATVMRNWLQDASERQRVGERGRLMVERNRGTGGRLLSLVQQLLNETAERYP